MEEINNNIVNLSPEELLINQNQSNNINLNEKTNISDKSIGNAISAYLMIFVSWLFLFNSTNKNINNEFVKWHTKSAWIIHLWFFITYIIFISNSLFSNIWILWIWLNVIITDLIFIWLLTLLIMWVYKAKNGLSFNISKNISISNKHTILDINGDWEITEEEKLTILLSYVPLVWFINYGKYSENNTIQESTRLNITVSVIISLLYIFGHVNLANLFSLIYIILVSFIWINLFTRNELLQIKLPESFSPSKIYILIIVWIKYLKNYFSEEKFKDFTSIENIELENLKENEKKDITLLNEKKDLRPAKFLIYIPFLNLIFIFYKNTKYSFHIINWVMITILISIFISISYFSNLSYDVLLLSLFPILFGIWYSKYKLEYKMPFIFDLYNLLAKMSWFVNFWTKKINEKRKEINEVSLKVEWDIINTHIS